jgi:hypothetical protein
VRRLSGALLLGTAGYVVVSTLSVVSWGADPECYLSARWSSGRWEYGEQVCFPYLEEDLPEPRGLGAPDSPAPDAAEMQLRADARLIAEVIVGEDPRAPHAVAWVVLNRARERRQTILEVVSARRQFHGWWLGRRWHAGSVRVAELSAREVLRGHVPDPTRGATHFHRVGSSTPAWAPAPGKWRRVGSHYFYREAPLHRPPVRGRL